MPQILNGSVDASDAVVEGGDFKNLSQGRLEEVGTGSGWGGC